MKRQEEKKNLSITARIIAGALVLLLLAGSVLGTVYYFI